MPIAYPFGLNTVISTSKARSQPAAFRVSEPRRGFAYFQASGTDTPVFWDVIFRFDKCDAANFIMWFTQDLQRGVLDFDMPIKTEFGLLTHTCRFMPDALLDAREIAEVFEYRAQIMTRAQVIPADALTAWGGVFSGPIPDQFMAPGAAFSLNISTYFTGGLGPFTYSVASGILPAGLTLNASTGVLSGTPTVADSLGNIVFRRSGAYCLREHSNTVLLLVQAADTHWANVLIYLNAATTLTTDASPLANALSASGVSLDAAVPLFGRPTYLVPDSGTNRIALTSSDAWIATALAANEWALDVHARPLGAGPAETRFSSFGPMSMAWDDANQKFVFTCQIGGSSYSLSTANGLAVAGTMYHVRAARDHSSGINAVLKLYLNGVLAATSSTFPLANTVQTGAGFGWLIGYNSIGAWGNFTNFRLTKLTARNYANFPAPTAPYPTY